MKHVVLIRHAKSSWSNPDLEDRERPLKKRGIVDARHMSKHLLDLNLLPDIVISSPAQRALQTAQIFVEQMFELPFVIQQEESLYFEGVLPSINLIKQVDNHLNTIFMFGHMPDIAALFTELSSEFVLEYPTCTVAHIQFEIENWGNIQPQSGKKMLLLCPKKMPWREPKKQD